MKKMKALLSVLLCGVMLFALLSGCASQSASPASSAAAPDAGPGTDTPAQTVKITFWKAPHASNEAELWQPVLDKFAEEHPEIEVEFLVTPWESWNEKYSSAFAGGTPPDVCYMTEGFPSFASAGQLEDLTPYITEELRAKYTDELWKTCEYNGITARVPFLNLTSIVFYNKAMFAEEEIEIPQTWDELLAAAKALTKDTDGDGKTDQWGFFLDLLRGEMNLHQIAPFIYQSGATFLNEDGTALGFNNPAGIRGIQYITDFMVKDNVAPAIGSYSAEEAQQLFYDGKVAMYAQQCQFGQEVKINAPDLELGAFMMPAGPNPNEAMSRANYGGNGGLSMAAASKEKEAAWTFIKFLTFEENGAIYLHANNMLDASAEVSQRIWAEDEIMSVAAESVPNSYSTPVDPRWYSQVDPILKLMIEEILRGAKDVETAVADADAQVKEILAQ